MKNSIAIVKLKSAKNKLERLRKENKHDEATKVTQELEAKNQKIIEAFVSEFDFCSYYFFHAESYYAIKSKDYKNVTLLDAEGTKVPTEETLSNGFYIISFDGSYPTTFVTVDKDGTRHQVGGTGGTVNHTRYPSAVVLDQDFVQLVKPFPYSSGPSVHHHDKSALTRVKFLNNRLKEFLNMNLSKVEKFKDYAGSN